MNNEDMKAQQALPKRRPGSKKTQGLFRKFHIHRVDGTDAPGCKHHGCDYFVLDVTHDKYAKAALAAYAESCKESYPHLSADMLTRYGLHERQQSPQPTDALVKAVELPDGNPRGWEGQKIFEGYASAHCVYKHQFAKHRVKDNVWINSEADAEALAVHDTVQIFLKIASQHAQPSPDYKALYEQEKAWRSSDNASLTKEIEDLQAQPSPPSGEHPVFAFLLGEGELEGHGFGDEPPLDSSGRKTPYWWRRNLRAALHPDMGGNAV